MVDFKKMSQDSAARRLIRSESCVQSDNNDYRYWLARKTMGPPNKLADGFHQGMIFVMLNPSTARADTRDPTDMRVQSFALKFGAKWYGIVNLFATSSPDPKSIFDFGYDSAVGSQNDEIIGGVFREALDYRLPVVCAWGKPSLRTAQVKLVRQRASEVMHAYNVRRAIAEWHPEGERPHPLYALAQTLEGWARHPLYLGLAQGNLTPHRTDIYSGH